MNKLVYHLVTHRWLLIAILLLVIIYPFLPEEAKAMFRLGVGGYLTIGAVLGLVFSILCLRHNSWQDVREIWIPIVAGAFYWPYALYLTFTDSSLSTSGR